jgi:transcriptional regulator with XRE-family HTH domain
MHYTQHSPDWPALIKQLKAIGIQQTEIAAHCGVSNSTLSELVTKRAKRDPGYLIGVRLVELHKKNLRKINHKEKA